MMKKVWYLQHTHFGDMKGIGIYTRYELALQAKKDVENKLGFVDYPENFQFIEYILNQDLWGDFPVTQADDPVEAMVYSLWHIRDDEADDYAILGIYTTAELAEQARERACRYFQEDAANIQPDKGQLDRTWWEEGFISWDQASELITPNAG